jgi:hypothetical protein
MASLVQLLVPQANLLYRAATSLHVHVQLARNPRTVINRSISFRRLYSLSPFSQPTRVAMADPTAQDFADTPPITQTRSRGATISTDQPSVAYDIEANAPVRRNMSFTPRMRRRRSSSSSSLSPVINPFSRDGPTFSRLQRANTVLHYHTSTERPDSWEHGAEPGIDTRKDPEPPLANLIAECQITTVDFSPDNMEKHEHYSTEFLEFIENPRPDWAKCRWINVNGLSWDVIKALGNKYNLHRLAIEDMINTKGRAKADWYPDSIYSKFRRSLLPG